MLLLLTSCASGSGSDSGPPVTGISTSDHDGYRGIFMDKPYVVPDLTLTDTAGKPFDLATRPRRTLVFFGYSNCPDVCPIVMSTLASAVAKLSTEERAQVQVAFVTTDPARDTRSKLRTYLDRYDPGFVGVTGSLDQIDTLGKAMDVYVKQGQKLPSGGYEVDHSSVVIAVHQGAGDLVWTGATSPTDIATDLKKILKADA